MVRVKNTNVEYCEVNKNGIIITTKIPSITWNLYEGDCYWFVNPSGSIERAVYGDSEVDRSRVSAGNCFRTSSEVGAWNILKFMHKLYGEVE